MKSSLLNNWETEKIIHRDRIMEFEFLSDTEFITEIEDGYFYLNTPLYDVEKKLYDEKNKKLVDELHLTNVQKEVKGFIKKLHQYNEAKDIAQSLMGKIADLRGVSIKEIHDEMNVGFDST